MTRPLAVTNSLNFGSPEDPAVMWQFAEAVRGLADGCAALGVPVTGGNVSFYNQTGTAAIHPTPVVGVLGVHDDVRRNGEVLGLSGYREMLLGDYRSIPDLRFTIELLVADTTHVAARLVFDCTPRGEFLGIPVDGRRVAFSENVFYAYVDGRIADVRAVIDTTAIRAQLQAGPGLQPPA